MQVIIVWFMLGSSPALAQSGGYAETRPKAVFCTAPMSIEEATQKLPRIAAEWMARKEPGLAPPNIITSEHPYYASALAECKLRTE